MYNLKKIRLVQELVIVCYKSAISHDVESCNSGSTGVLKQNVVALTVT
jgi:hypothetical protein